VRFNNLQVLRLVAAGGVVLLHLGTYAANEFGVGAGPDPWYRGRWFGTFICPLFFAVSGFVLTHLLQTASPRRFLIHRALRLYPAYWTALALIVLSRRIGIWPGPYVLGLEPAPTLDSILVVPPRSERGLQYPLMVEWTLIYEVALWIGLVALWGAVGRRRVPVAAAGWLAVLAVKSVLWPGYGSRLLPTWNSVWLSVYVVPFLLGILAYTARERGRILRWPVVAVVIGLNAAAGVWLPQHTELDIWLRGLAAGLTVWFVVQIRDASATNPLVVAGGYSYGLYLLHVPVLMFAFRLMQRTGFLDRTETGVVVAGVAAVTVGLAFGRIELAAYGRLKRYVDRTVLPAGRRTYDRLAGLSLARVLFRRLPLYRGPRP
jgi:peptidoglycan/LPS O-acetylase OafA/YrhL